MLHTLLPIIAVIATVTLAKLLTKRPRTQTKREKVFAKKPLSENEQPMFFRLVESFPDHVVLAQVAFSAIIDRQGKHWSNRSDFNRLYTDFVVCTKAFDVVAVIELDDRSHNGKANSDKQRDALLKEAGYRILRYPTVPTMSKLQNDIQPL